jgi:hypothetical protein
LSSWHTGCENEPTHNQPEFDNLKVVEYTRAELVTIAQAAGFPHANEALVSAWAQDGLLAKGVNIGRGKGGDRGALYVWSEAQKNLFLSVLKFHVPGTKAVPRLLGIPTCTWLYWGWQYVPLVQLRKAMEKWSFHRTKAGHNLRRTEPDVRRVVKTWRDPSGSAADRRALEDALTDAYVHQTWDTSRLLRLGRAALDPAGHRKLRLPRETTIEDVITLLLLEMHGHQLLPKATDEQFAHVQHAQRQHARNYIRNWRRTAKEASDIPIDFEPPSVAMFMDLSCSDVVQQLGLIKLAEATNTALPVLPDYLDNLDGNFLFKGLPHDRQRPTP